MVGAGLALVTIGPGLAPGAWMNLDLLVFDDLPVPRGTWGLGPELPRRVPLWTVMAWLGALGGGEVASRVLLVGLLVAAFAGAYRLATSATADRAGQRGGGRLLRGGGSLPLWPTALASALLWTLNPFLLTRVAVGHWPVVVTMAVLPWALGDLLDPLRSARRVLAWSFAFAFAGVHGAVVGGAYLLAGLVVGVVERARTSPGAGRRSAVVLLAWVVGQLTWLVPMVVVVAGSAGRDMVDSASFPTRIDDLGDLGGLVAGLGFWNPGFQLGGDGGWVLPLVGFLLLGLAAVGHADLPRRWRAPLLLLAALSLATALASSMPGVAEPFAAFTRSPVGAPFRESQRNLPPLLLWVALAAPLGARQIALRLRAASAGAVAVVPLALALVAWSPSVWGLDGQLAPVTVPSDWAALREQVESEPGTVVALPWYQYYTSDLSDERLVLTPFPLFLGGDVITSSDPGLEPEPSQEVADGRELVVRDLVDQSREGVPVASQLAELGVRWVAVEKDVDWRSYRGIVDDPAFERVVDGPGVALLRVPGWAGAVTDPAGDEVASEDRPGPWLALGSESAVAVSTAYQQGWLRGLEPGREGPDGRLTFGEGSGPLWFWPAVVVLVADLTAVVAFVWVVVWPRRRGRRRAAAAIGDGGA